MEYLTSVKVDLFDLDICSICENPILPDEEAVETVNENQAVYRRDHFLCAFPNGGDQIKSRYDYKSKLTWKQQAYAIVMGLFVSNIPYSITVFHFNKYGQFGVYMIVTLVYYFLQRKDNMVRRVLG